MKKALIINILILMRSIKQRVGIKKYGALVEQGVEHNLC